jgi:hypothetical protein
MTARESRGQQGARASTGRSGAPKHTFSLDVPQASKLRSDPSLGSEAALGAVELRHRR